MVPQIFSIQVGLPKLLGIANAPDPMDRPWSTEFFKEPVQGMIWLGSTNLAGDGQADLKHHGGVEKAELVYAAEYYPSWRSRLNLPNLSHRAFGENFTVADQTEASVCIGDIYDIGEVQVQVSQPRQQCWKLSRRWRIRDLALQVQCTGQTGWYFRVLKEDAVEAGMELVLRDRPFPQWTIARANQIMHHDLNNRKAAAELASCRLLASNWQRTLLNRAAKSKSFEATV
jgi:MOSC domain-containing protein YiiM